MWYRLGMTNARKHDEPVCAEDGCCAPVRVRRLCTKHYGRLRRSGEVYPASTVHSRRGPGRGPEADRFWARVDKSAGPDGCWLWLGGRKHNGYGTTRYRGKTARAHRVSFEMEAGRTPALYVLHRCDNPPCVNPSHLYEGTQKQNMADMIRRGRLGLRGRKTPT